MSIEDRVGSLERETARHGEQLGRLSADLGHVRQSVADVGADVKELLGREARRPGTPTLQTIALTCGGISAIGAVVWWLIAQSPAVQELRDRMGRLDDPTVGRVPALERRTDRHDSRLERIETLDGWAPAVVRRGR